MIQSKTKVFISSVFLGLMLANFASAQLVACGGTGQTACQISDLIFTIERIINFLLSWAWLISIFFILWAGLKFMNSAGNTERIAEAKKTLTNALIGFVIIMVAYLAIDLVISDLVGQTNQGRPVYGQFNIIRNLLPTP